MSNLDGINFYGDITLDDMISRNMVHFLRYGLLEIGAFYNITKDKLNHRGENISILTPVSGAGLTNYTIYSGIKSDWVYENNITLKYPDGSQPVRPSGIYVNDTFYPTGTNVNGGQYYIDYSHGQIIFTSPLTRNDVVKCDYSVRAVNVYPSDGPEYRTLVAGWRESLSATTGRVDISARAYLPCIGVHVNGYKTIRGLEMGSRVKITEFDLEFSVFSQNSNEQKKLLDTLYMMEEKNPVLFNVNNINYPLNSRGELVNENATYPNYILNYPYQTGHFVGNARVFKNNNLVLPLYFGTLRIGLQVNAVPY